MGMNVIQCYTTLHYTTLHYTRLALNSIAVMNHTTAYRKLYFKLLEYDPVESETVPVLK